MRKSIHCECHSGQTCRHCLDNRKPYFFTGSEKEQGRVFKAVLKMRAHEKPLARLNAELWKITLVHEVASVPARDLPGIIASVDALLVRNSLLPVLSRNKISATKSRKGMRVAPGVCLEFSSWPSQKPGLTCIFANLYLKP